MAASLNRIMVIGNLGRDPEIRHNNAAKAVTNFSVAVNSKRNGQEETEWFRVICFEKLAENAANLLSKGSSVFVEGRLQTRQYDDKNGARQTAVEIIASNFQILSSRGENGGGGGAPRPASSAPASTDELSSPIDDEIPF